VPSPHAAARSGQLRRLSHPLVLSGLIWINVADAGAVILLPLRARCRYGPFPPDPFPPMASSAAGGPRSGRLFPRRQCREPLMDLFTADRHVVLALYCIAIALFVALFLLAALAADYVDEAKKRQRRNKKWWQK
jgi:hypothetical protein